MINLSDITSYYIEVMFTDQQKLLILDSFSLLEGFGLKFYEDKYIDLISKSDTIDNSTQTLMFMDYLADDLKAVVAQHGITLSADQVCSLSDLTELGHLLLLLPNMEDYSDVAYKVHGNKPPRNTFIDLVERFSTMTLYRAMEIIEDVSEELIETLRNISAKAFNTSTESVSLEHTKHINVFRGFIDNTPCVGFRLLDEGYPSSLTLEELLKTIPFDIQKNVDELYLTNLPQLSLDVLSLLVVTRDDYTMPLFKLKKHIRLFTDNHEAASRINNLVFKIVNDFSLYLEAYKQGEQVNGN